MHNVDILIVYNLYKMVMDWLFFVKCKINLKGGNLVGEGKKPEFGAIFV